MYINLEGNWKVRIEDKEYDVMVPGTLDENGVGGADELLLKKEGREFVKADGPIASRFTRKNYYMGEAVYSRVIDSKDVVDPDCRVFLEVERSRGLKLFVDGKKVESIRGTLSTPYVFEVTGLVHEGSRIELVCDNSYEGMPAANILYSSAATDETQTNWNGLIGKVGFKVVPGNFIDNLRIYTRENRAYVKAAISADAGFQGNIVIRSKAFREEAAQMAISNTNDYSNNCIQIETDSIELASDVLKWDEYEGNLYCVEATLYDLQGKEIHSVSKTFGIRDFGYDNTGRLTINGRRFFLRGEANCAEFPEEGHWPMDKDRWLDIMEKYKSYGINCVRFHSHCPPEAAFEAADKLGIMVQPELSHWNPVDAFIPENSYEYYKKELVEIITSYANHPSFVMLTLGNELHSSEAGISKMEELLDIAKSIDDTRLYAWGSNNFYGDRGANGKSDFYTASDYRKTMLRATSAGMKGHLNEDYPSACHNFNEVCNEIRKEYCKPIFGFEVGQYEILPDFDEIQEFRGVSDPVNYKMIRDRAEQKGALKDWKKYVEATGETALMCYGEEVEAVLRTPEMSGLSLLGIQDFPGQGTALVGMMNSHMEPKPYKFAAPERFREFFAPVRVLACLPKYTYTFSELLSCDITIANYGKRDIGGEIEVEISEENTGIGLMHQTQRTQHFPKGELTTAGKLGIRFSLLKSGLGRICIPEDVGVCLVIRISLLPEESRGIENEPITSTYKIWAFPDITPAKPDSVYETASFDDTALKVLEEGGTVFLSPFSDKESLPHSIKAQFSTDFWSVGTFDFQEGGMGQYIDDSHPLFKRFPTGNHNEWQWWPMAGRRAVFVPDKIKPIIKELDSYSYLRNMAKLFECRCLKGRVMFSSMGLSNLLEYPEAKALLYAIYAYLDSDDFAPTQELTPGEIKALFD